MKSKYIPHNSSGIRMMILPREVKYANRWKQYTRLFAKMLYKGIDGMTIINDHIPYNDPIPIDICYN